MKLKKCFKCGREQPRSDFYKHSMMADGLLGKCKECTKLDVRRHRRVNSDKVRAYDRSRNCGTRLEEARKRTNEYRVRFPEKTSARQALANAVRSGRIVRQPCEECGDQRSVGHHDDYGKPLVVRWLCQMHHMRHHFGKAV